MKTYAIRKKGTQDYLPARAGRGFTHDEPILNGGPKGPRTFPKRGSANLALHHWLKGVLEYVGHGWVEVQEAELDYRSMPHRKAEDMEIVEFNLVEVKND